MSDFNHFCASEIEVENEKGDEMVVVWLLKNLKKSSKRGFFSTSVFSRKIIELWKKINIELKQLKTTRLVGLDSECHSYDTYALYGEHPNRSLSKIIFWNQKVGPEVKFLSEVSHANRPKSRTNDVTHTNFNCKAVEVNKIEEGIGHKNHRWSQWIKNNNRPGLDMNSKKLNEKLRTNSPDQNMNWTIPAKKTK